MLATLIAKSDAGAVIGFRLSPPMLRCSEEAASTWNSESDFALKRFWPNLWVRLPACLAELLNCVPAILLPTASTREICWPAIGVPSVASETNAVRPRLPFSELATDDVQRPGLSETCLNPTCSKTVVPRIVPVADALP